MSFRTLSAVTAAVAFLLPSLLSAAAFTPGNVVVLQAGNGTGALVNTGNPIVLQEFTPAGGAPVQSITLPVTANGAQQPCVVSGTATSEGLMSLSTDGQYLVGGCFASTIPAASSLPASASGSVKRVVFRIDATGAVDTSTALSDFADAGDPRSAATTNGTDLWVSGSTGGARYATFGASTSTQLSTTSTNLRQMAIFSGQLYTTTGSGSLRVATVGTGLPTTSGQTITNLSGLPTATISPYGAVFLDRSATVAGIDTLYFADDRASGSGGGILKYSFDGATWTARGTLAGSFRGLAAAIVGSDVVLYATGSAAPSTLVTATDTAAFDATITGAFTTLTTGGANTAFRSVTFVPAATAPTLSIAPASTNEGDSPGCVSTPLDFTVTSSSAAPVGGITFNFSTADGTATLADNDYTQVIAGSGTIAAGQTTGTATVNVTCDKNAEGNEKFDVNLIDGATYDLGAPSTAKGSILDDDTPNISVADVSQAELNSGSSVFAFAVTLNRPAPTGGVTFNIVTSDGSATLADNDYANTVVNNALIPAGASTVNFNVNVNGDTAIEADEVFNVTISNLSSNVAAGGNDLTAVGTIQNDDAAVTPTFNIGDAGNVTEDNGQGTVQATFAVTLSPAPAGNVSVDVATAIGSAGTGDFTAIPTTTLQFSPTVLTQNVVVTITGDTTVESSENFTVQLSNPSAGTAIGDGSGSATILDNDINQSLSINDLTLAEGNSGSTNFSFTVSLAQPVPVGYGNVTVDFGTAGGSASSPSDFATNTGTLTFAPGESSKPVVVAVVGDLNQESDEIFFVNLTGASGTNLSVADGQGQGTITNDDSAPVRSIAEIQGDAFQSPFNTTIATTLGNVVTAVISNGFFIQDPTPDALLDTSDAMFVFTSSAPTVQVGDLVDIRGSILEAAVTVPAGAPNYSNLTKFTNTGLVVNVVSSGNSLPAPFVLDAAMPSPDPAVPFCVAAGGTFTAGDFANTKNFECLEGMRVSTTQGITNAPNQSFAGDPLAEINITTSGLRAFREPGMTIAAAAENLNLISLTPPAPPLASVVWDGNPEVFEIDLDRLGLPNTPLVPGSRFSATGILGFEFGGYELFPDSINVFAPAPPIPGTVPSAGSDQLTIGSLNTHRFFDRCDDPSRPNSNEDVDVPFAITKLDKLSRYIREVIKTPDVIGIEEAEQPSAAGTVCSNGEVNTPALQLLADKIVADGGPTYTPIYAPLTNDVGYINVAFLVRSDRINVASTTQLRASETWVFNGGAPSLLNDRPSFLMEASTLFTPTPLNFALMVNHLRSLTGIDDLSPVADQIDAHRVRQKHLRQAIDVACDAQAYQTANPTKPLILVGDFNAFQFSDGYADTAGIIRGDTNPANNEYNIDFVPAGERCAQQPNGQIVSPAITEAVFSLPEDQHYSFYFSGVPQELDHAFLTAAATQRFEGMAYGRGNADSQPANEFIAGTALRTSDHDGFVIYLNAGTDATSSGFTLFKDGFE